MVHYAPCVMTCSKLPNYLRTYRKRTGLSQRDIAYLLGGHDAARVSRYEHFNSTPSLRIALAFVIIFQKTARELFSGEYQKVEKVVQSRARSFAARLATCKHDQSVDRKSAVLEKIISAPSTDDCK